MGVTTTEGRGSAEDGKQQSALKNPAVATIARRRGDRGIGGGDDKTTDNNDHHNDHDDHDTTIKQCTTEWGSRKRMCAGWEAQGKRDTIVFGGGEVNGEVKK